MTADWDRDVPGYDRAHLVTDYGENIFDYTVYPSGRDALIVRLMYHYMVIADLTNSGYGERWCYADLEGARKAVKEWDGGHDTEPEGWHRHHLTGRRRPDGDASREYIAH